MAPLWLAAFLYRTVLISQTQFQSHVLLQSGTESWGGSVVSRVLGGGRGLGRVPQLIGHGAVGLFSPLRMLEFTLNPIGAFLP